MVKTYVQIKNQIDVLQLCGNLVVLVELLHICVSSKESFQKWASLVYNVSVFC